MCFALTATYASEIFEKENISEANYHIDNNVTTKVVDETIAPCFAQFQFLDPVTYEVKWIVNKTQEVTNEKECFDWATDQTIMLNEINPNYVVTGSGSLGL